jgi:hypothetical protein
MHVRPVSMSARMVLSLMMKSLTLFGSATCVMSAWAKDLSRFALCAVVWRLSSGEMSPTLIAKYLD